VSEPILINPASDRENTYYAMVDDEFKCFYDPIEGSMLVQVALTYDPSWDEETKLMSFFRQLENFQIINDIFY
jgi:hypothetical protein